MTTLATAPGKLVLLGEYVVLEGAPAVVAAVNRRASVQADPARSFSLSIPSLRIFAEAFSFVDGKVLFHDPALQADLRLSYFCGISAAACEIAQQLGGQLHPVTLTLDTTAFFLPGAKGEVSQKLGLGSSAALCVAMLAAYLGVSSLLASFLPLSLAANRNRLLAFAHLAHGRVQHMGGSGIDIAASIHGGVQRFEWEVEKKTHMVHPLEPLPDMHMLAVWSGTSASTSFMLARVAALKARDPKLYWQIYEKLGIYANAGAEFWALRNSAALCTVIDAFYETLLWLGEACETPIITAAHAAIRKQVQRAGGFYKSSGAGGGDMGVAFCPTAHVANRCAHRLKAKNHLVLPLEIDPQGLLVAQ